MSSHKRINQPLVSVLIPIYNGTEYLEEAIDSVLASDYRNVEIILIDDGSTDESHLKCHAYEKKYKNIRFFGFKNNRGMTRCLNYGIEQAKGKYIARMNQDDLMLKNRLSLQVGFLEKNPDYNIVGGAITLFTNTNDNFDQISFPLSDDDIRSQWLLFSPYSDPTVMYRKDAWLKTQGYNQYFWPADDVHLWYQLGNIGKMANLEDTLMLIRWHDDAGSIKIHRRQMLKTWQVHNWAAEMIQKPSFSVKIFWIFQLLAGYIFPAQFNWWVYRVIRKAQKYYFKNRARITLPSLSGNLLFQRTS